jgi:hypothetical protein
MLWKYQKLCPAQLRISNTFHSSKPFGMTKSTEGNESGDLENVDLSKIVVNSSRKASTPTSLDRERIVCIEAGYDGPI